MRSQYQFFTLAVKRGMTKNDKLTELVLNILTGVVVYIV